MRMTHCSKPSGCPVSSHTTLRCNKVLILPMAILHKQHIHTRHTTTGADFSDGQRSVLCLAVLP